MANPLASELGKKRLHKDEMVLTMNYLCLFNSLESLLHYNVHYKTVFDTLQKLQLPSTNFYHCISIYSSQYMQISIRLKNHKGKKEGMHLTISIDSQLSSMGYTSVF